MSRPLDEKNKIILIGGGGHCHSCIDVIEQENRFEIIGIIDNNKPLTSTVLGYKVLGNDEGLASLFNDVTFAMITVGQIKTSLFRNDLYHKLLTLGYQLPVSISPIAYVAKDVCIGMGSMIMHGAIINRSACIGNNTIINTKALIEHEVKVGSHCHISTNAVINGACTIGDNTFIGSNAVIVQGVNVPNNSFIKANTLYKGIA